MTCLYVLGIIATTCIQGAEPIGICHPVGDDTIYCTIDLEEMPVWASYYNPELGGTNCFENTCHTLGDGTPTRDGYGRFMACPIGLYGKTITFEHAGTWQCRDHGGAIKVNYGERYTPDGFVTGWEVVFDFLLLDAEWWTYHHLDIISIE